MLYTNALEAYTEIKRMEEENQCGTVLLIPQSGFIGTGSLNTYVESAVEGLEVFNDDYRPPMTDLALPGDLCVAVIANVPTGEKMLKAVRLYAKSKGAAPIIRGTVLQLKRAGTEYKLGSYDEHRLASGLWKCSLHIYITVDNELLAKVRQSKPAQLREGLGRYCITAHTLLNVITGITDEIIT